MATLKQQVKELLKGATPEEVMAELVAQRKPFKMPKTLGATADAVNAHAAQRSSLNKITEVLREEEQEMRNRLLAELPAVEGQAATGNNYMAELKPKSVAQVKDKAKLLPWAIKAKATDILTISVKAPEAEKMRENGVSIPGVEWFNTHSLSITKRKK